MPFNHSDVRPLVPTVITGLLSVRYPCTLLQLLCTWLSYTHHYCNTALVLLLLLLLSLPLPATTRHYCHYRYRQCVERSLLVHISRCACTSTLIAVSVRHVTNRSHSVWDDTNVFHVHFRSGASFRFIRVAFSKTETLVLMSVATFAYIKFLKIVKTITLVIISSNVFLCFIRPSWCQCHSSSLASVKSRSLTYLHVIT